MSRLEFKKTSSFIKKTSKDVNIIEGIAYLHILCIFYKIRIQENINMALWLVRAGSRGEFEEKCLAENRVYLTWGELQCDLSQASSQVKIRDLLEKACPNNAAKKNVNHGSQIWAFSHRIKVGDWIALPSKIKSAVHFAKVTSEYQFDPNAQAPFYHYRSVDWFARDIPRSSFDQDILYSLGAFMTVCQVKRNNAEQRIHKMAENNWKAPLLPHDTPTDEEQPIEFTDLELLANDQIAKQITAKFKGHGMAALVDCILRAQGYTTYLSPEGPDKGVDILAGLGPMGFGEPRICVQVKSGDGPLDRPTLDQLIGTMQNVQATQGLLVSWSGFKNTVDREKASQFFRVRLWDQKDLIEQLLKYYDKLDEDIKADLPLKRIWTIANPEAEEE